MPDRLAQDLIMFMRQNDWKLPKKRRRDEVRKLTDPEIDTLENIVRTIFASSED